jgi:hypothetical protein
MSALRVAITAVTVAASLARHPLVRAGIKAAPRLATPAMREAAAQTARSTAYSAGVLVRRIVKGR